MKPRSSPKKTRREKAAHPRRRARAWALQILYQMETAGSSAEETLESFWREARRRRDGARDYAERLVKGAAADVPALDAAVEAVLKHWKLGRLALIDRLVMRLALAEHAAKGAPRKVILDEAVELARRFGDADSPAFVNGVLDAVLPRDAENDETPAREARLCA